jgi:hypothetical protein
MAGGEVQKLGRDSRAGQVTLETINVATTNDMHEAINRYLMLGFTIKSQTPEMTALVKEPIIGTTNLFATIKEQHWTSGEIVKLILLTLCCFVPGSLYLRGRLRAHATTENVVIRVDPSSAAIGASQASQNQTDGFQMNEDRSLWWNGTAWISCEASVPPGAQLSDDGAMWWDGELWRPVPSG